MTTAIILVAGLLAAVAIGVPAVRAWGRWHGLRARLMPVPRLAADPLRRRRSSPPVN